MPTFPMGQVPEYFAGLKPEDTAVVFADRSLSWSRFAGAVTRRAHGMMARGVKEGDFVTIALPNGTAFLETVYAALRLGAIPNPVPSRLPVAELNGILELARPGLVVGTLPAEIKGWNSVASEWEGEDASGLLPNRISRHWKAMTSGGSTGRPKLIVASGEGVVDLDSINPLMPTGPDSKCCHVPGPLYHNGPFSTSMMALNGGRCLVGSLRFDPEETLRLVATHKADWLYQVPTMMHRIWSLPPEVRSRYDLSSLKRVLHLAAPCPPWLKEAWIEWLGADVVWELYGGTEAQGFTLIAGTEWLQHRGSVGRFVGGAQVKIVDDDGSELPTGEVGEVFILAPGGRGSTYHYLGAEARAMGDWESLGDMGWLDADGYLYLADRRTDLILRGGANIYPAEVEAAIDECPEVSSSVVIGLPHADLGATVHAIVQLRSGQRNTRDAELALRSFLKDRLASYKLPATFEFVDDFTRDEAGKVRRSALRAERMGKQPTNATQS
ncbi:MAG: AMP-binding protein [Micropepsaceae bacterium]